MAIPTGDKTLLESHPHKVKFYLVVHQPGTIMSARVNGAPNGDPITTIIYDGASGDWNDIEAGQTLLIGSAAGGHQRGIVRVRSATSTVLTIAESSDLRDIADNDHLTVLREHRFWIKYPRVIDEDNIFEDYDVAHVDESTSFPPLPLIGPCAFGFGAPQTFSYDFSESQAVFGSSISSYASVYQLGDSGTGSASTDTETYSSVTGSAGSETKLTVTDNLSKSAIGYRYDFVLNRTGANSPIQNWAAKKISNSKAGHEEVEFIIYGSESATTTVRDGTRVWIVFESWYASTNKEIPNYYTNRANILFEGWIVGDTIHKDSDHNYTTFKAAPITKLLEDGLGYPATLEISDSPGEWYQVSSCTSVKSAIYIAQQRCNLTEIVDVHVPTTDVATAGEDWGSGSIKQQLMEPLQDEFMFVAQSRDGQVWIEKDARMLSDSARSALDAWITLETKHIIKPVDIPEIIRAQANYVFAEGVYYSSGTSTPYFSEAPGKAPLYEGPSSNKITRLALSSQAHLNQMSGDALAVKNARYSDITLRLTGFWPIFDPVPQRRIALSGLTSNRGSDLSAINFLVESVSYQIDKGHAITEIKLTEETNGLDGRTVSYTTSVPASTANPDPPTVDEVGGEGTSEGDAEVETYNQWIVGSATTGCYYTDQLASTPTYYALGALTGDKAKIRYLAFSPPPGVAGTTYVYAISLWGIHRHTMPPSAADWEDMVSAEAIESRASDDWPSGSFTGDSYIDHIAFSVDNPSKSYIYMRTDSAGVCYHIVAFSNDGWATITTTAVLVQEAAQSGTRADVMGRVSINPDSDSTVICAFSRNMPGTDRADLYRSTDFAANWSSIDSVEDAGGEKGGLCCYHTADSDYIYWLARDSGTLRVSTNGGASFATETTDGDDMLEMYPRPGNVDILDCTFPLGLYRWNRGGANFTLLVMTGTLSPSATWAYVYARDGSNVPTAYVTCKNQDALNADVTLQQADTAYDREGNIATLSSDDDYTFIIRRDVP